MPEFWVCAKVVAKLTWGAIELERQLHQTWQDARERLTLNWPVNRPDLRRLAPRLQIAMFHRKRPRMRPQP